MATAQAQECFSPVRYRAWGQWVWAYPAGSSTVSPCGARRSRGRKNTPRPCPRRPNRRSPSPRSPCAPLRWVSSAVRSGPASRWRHRRSAHSTGCSTRSNRAQAATLGRRGCSAPIPGRGTFPQLWLFPCAPQAVGWWSTAFRPVPAEWWPSAARRWTLPACNCSVST